MRVKLLLLIILFVPNFGESQQMIHKHYFSAEIGVGQSFPDFESNSYWTGMFYPGIQSSIGYKVRLNKKWEFSSKVGLSSYMLVNRSKLDKYIFDFASPSFEIGTNYVRIKNHFDGLIGINFGGQVGYFGGVLSENFTDYVVNIIPKRFYLFLRPEVGLRKSYSSLKKTFQHEFGTFFRYNFTRLGTVEFIGSDYNISTSPRGNLIGVFYRFSMNLNSKFISINKGNGNLPRF